MEKLALFFTRMKVAAIVAIVAILSIAWFSRFELVPFRVGSLAGMYMVNKWTGTVYVVHGVNIREASQP